LLFKTRMGVTMRATVDDRSLLMLNGGRPDRMSLFSWGIGAALAGLAGVLLSPQQGALQIFALTLLIFDAYPAAVVGRLRSVPLTYIGAMVLGLSKLYFDWISPARSGWPFATCATRSLPCCCSVRCCSCPRTASVARSWRGPENGSGCRR
jgi:branched-subunit amino acid ABC-type transport system permease component